MIQDLIESVVRFATLDRTVDGVRAALILVLTILVTRYGSRWARRVVAHRDPERAPLAGRLAAWAVLALGVSAAFEELGFKLHVLLGAAGVLSVAVGFAAQSTLSNLISGFFLFGERPFTVGDTIEVDGVAGEVLGIELLATTLRTADNRFVRVPNESLIKTRVTNQTRFPTRRLELVVPLANDEDFGKARAAMLEVIASDPRALTEPRPSVFIGGFDKTSVHATVWVWAAVGDLQLLRASLAGAIHAALAGVKRGGPGL